MHRRIMVLALLLSYGASAYAGVILTLKRTGASVDMPIMSVEHTGGAALTALAVSLGDTSFNFDSAQPTAFTGSFSLTLLTPDEVNAEMRSDVLSWSLADFTSGDMWSARLDIDSDMGPATVDWQATLFNNGDLENAVLSLLWADGLTEDVAFHDELQRDPLAPYVIECHGVPETGSLWLALAGATALAWRRFSCLFF